MNEDFEIISENTAGEKYKVIFNQNILSLNRNDVIRITLPKEANSWSIKISFTDEESEKQFNASWVTLTDGVEITLNKWYSETWVENIIPYSLDSKDGKTKLKIKIRTTASPNKDFRSLIVTVWKAI
jgi:hypothetical protein